MTLHSVALAAVVAASSATAIPIGPPGVAFYNPPAKLPTGLDGAVIWAREFTGGAALPSAAVNYLVLYETVGPRGTFVAVSGMVAIPKGAPPSGGWPIISWAHGTSGNAPQCAPSRFSTLDMEQRAMDAFVRRGYAVAQTDYEGNGTPGIHPYFVATASARDVTDIVRAARELDPQIGRRWIAMGHSEGGTAALSTALLGPQWAPDLHLIGAVAYAPASHLEDMLQGLLLSPDPSTAMPFLGLMIEGFAQADPRIDPAQILEPDALRALPELQQRCIDDLASDSDWSRMSPSAMFRQSSLDLNVLYDDLAENSPESFAIRIPTLLVQGVSDPLVSSESTIDLCEHLRQQGTPVTFKAFTSATHATVLPDADAAVAAWTAARFAGVPPPPSSC